MPGIASEARGEGLSAYMRLFSRWIGIASIVLSAIIFAAETSEFLTLPDCDSERASASLLEVARAAQIEATSVRDPQNVASGADEISCKAGLALDAGAIVVNYRFFWDGWTQKIEITGVEE